MNINSIKKLGRKIIPSVRLRRFIKQIYTKYLITTTNKRHKRALRRIKNKKTIKVAFFVIHSSIWKYDGLYQLLEKNDRFDPVVVICPNIVQGEETMTREMMMAENLFKEKKYNFVTTFIKNSGTWLDVKKIINPDIIFFTNPHGLTKEQYYITNYINKLSVYVPYGIMAANIQKIQYDHLFHNLIWKCYYETTIHKQMAEKYARNKGRNVVITGYPGCDMYLAKSSSVKDPWKIKDRKVKRIIWAPHHTIETNEKELAYSNFLFDFQFMLELAVKFNDKIQIAFKPHPLLKAKLIELEDWGEERTNNYYNSWQNLANGQLVEDDYFDLFQTSDAMILDSISFMAEYLYTGKPSLFIVRDNTIKSKFNEFGKMVFDLLYKSYRNDEIINFITNVVIDEKDPFKKNRLDFLQNYLLPSNNKTASENIFNDLLREIL